MTDRQVSVVVVNFRTPGRSARLARSVASFKRVSEAIVVNNSPEDDRDLRAEIAEARGVEVVSNPTNLGYGRACNVGATVTSGKYLVFLNSDVQISEGDLEALVTALDDEEVGIAAPVLLDSRGRPQSDASGELPSARTLVNRTNRRGNRRLEWVSGAALAMRRSTFEQLGGFDPQFHMYFEDVDLCARAARTGARIVVVEDARATHESGASRSSSMKRQQQYAMSQARYLAKDQGNPLVGASSYLASWTMHLGRHSAARLRPLGRRLVDARERRRDLAALGARPSPRVNLGCGDHRVEGWINVDVLADGDVRPDLVANVGQPPFGAATVASLYCGHVLEHLDYDDAVEAARRIRAILTERGEVLAVGPDVDRCKRWVESGRMSPEELSAHVHGARRWPGDEHRWECTEERLAALFHHAGFSFVEPVDVTAVRGWPLTSRIGWQCGVRARP